MNTVAIPTPLPPAAADCNPLLVAHRWLGERLSQTSPMAPAARQVLQQLCSSAALHCFERGHGMDRLAHLLDAAGRIADAVNDAFADADRAVAWTRSAQSRPQLREIWLRYRDVRQLRSPALDRMLLEAMVCLDLRQAGMSAFSPPSLRPAASPATDAPSLLVAAALVMGCLWLQIPEPMLVHDALEAPAVTALAGAAGLLFWNRSAPGSRRRHDTTALVATLRRTLMREAPDLAAIAAAMRAMSSAGVVWSADTLQVLVRMRVNALPRPGRYR